MTEPNIAACLSEAIEESKRSYAWAADKVQVSEYTVRRWCSGLAVPGGQSMMRLRRCLPGFARRLDAPPPTLTHQGTSYERQGHTHLDRDGVIYRVEGTLEECDSLWCRKAEAASREGDEEQHESAG